MNIVTGDLWNTFGVADYLLATGNSFVKNDGALVMGRGAAKQMRDRFPGIDRVFGEYLNAHGHSYPSRNAYGVVISSGRGVGWQFKPWDDDRVTSLGIMQVKFAWYEEADLELLEFSITRIATFAKRNYPKVITMNYPAIGNGRRSESEVSPILQRHLQLHRNVFVYRYPSRS